MHSDEPSLLDHLSEIRKKALPEDGGVSTVIYCGSIKSEADMSDALATHRKIVEDEVNNEGCNITGILMGQGSGIIHLLEGPCVSVLNIVRSLSEHSQFKKDGLQSGRIVYNIEDRPCRFYPEWYSCIIQERRSQVDDVTADSSGDIVHDMAVGLFEVGKGLQNVAPGEVELNRYSNHLPGKNLILALSSSEHFFSIEEYVEVFADSYHVELESENNWPVEPLVRY